MATYSHLAYFNGATSQNINVSASGNILHVNELKVGAATNNLTATVLDNLYELQDGSDFSNGTNSHTHDGRYYTETELTSRTSSSGATLVAIERKTYANISGYTTLLADTLGNYNIQALLDAINTSLLAVGGSSFSDADFEIYNDADPTKLIAFDASAINTGTTRTIIMDDQDVDLAEVNTSIQQDGSRPFAADQDMGGFNLTNVADPTSAQHAATKAYVDAVAYGLKPKESVRAASTANVVIASELENGDTLDGVTLATGDRVLLKDQTAPAQNGIYVVAASGAASRSVDFDAVTPIDEINGAWVSVQEGTAAAGKVYVQYGTVTTVGTDPITFTFYDPIGTLVGGDMITVSGSTISVDLASDAGLESSNPGNAAGQLRVKLDGGSLARSSSGLKVATNGITATELADNAVDTAAIVDDAVTAAKLNSDVAGFGLAQDTNGSLDVRGTYLALTNNSGGSIAAGSLVKISGSGTFTTAGAATLAAGAGYIGVLLATTADAAVGQVQVSGIATVVGGGAFTPGADIFISTTAGTATATFPASAGNIVHKVGVAATASTVVLAGQFIYELV